MSKGWDVVVVGGGHAGAEAALASARLGAQTLLVTGNPATIGRMSCNPAVGGLAKGQVVREVDALGGAMGLVADRTAIQFKVLNASRGPAVRGLRCQSDKALYAAELRRLLSSAPNLVVAAGTAAGFSVGKGRLTGVVLEDGASLGCRAAVVTTGTFLSGLVHVGESRREAGRWDEPPARSLSGALAALGLRLGRMKTGTPPRVRAGTVNTALMERATGDARPVPFSFRSRREKFPAQRQVDCWLTHTGEAVHDLIRESLPLSPLYSGRITGRGPRYCPSIEDKVVRFPDRARHQIFVEPEGLSTDWLYLNGLSMSLPPGIQEHIVRLINGLERAEILRPAYAVEYDVVFPEQLDISLQTRALPGLFLAGQINGTSGYEEAAGQGLVAGTNAARAAKDLGEPFVLSRDEAYVGVMLDDLVTLGLDEPYRLLTSRAEHRLLLGPDSAYARLTARAVALGLVQEKDAEPILEAEARLKRLTAALGETQVTPDRSTRARLSREGVELTEETTLAGLVRRPEVDVGALRRFLAETLGSAAREDLASLDDEELDRAAAEVRYAVFHERERQTIARLKRAGGRRIPADFVYRGVPGLSLEATEKLERHRPSTLGQASRIPGVTPAATALLLARLLVKERGAAA
ncbi:MAG: tRNA uridine-5-carboxymethylaminomethyl(34) synthesis enzyme MnmG [Thermoanaerobaculia bacterium]